MCVGFKRLQNLHLEKPRPRREAPGVQARGRLRLARRGAARGTPRARAGRRAIRFARERGKARERRVAIAACGAAMEGLELRLAALERSSEQLC